MKIVIGAFDTIAEARSAVDALESFGFNEHDVSIIVNNEKDDATIATGNTTRAEHPRVGSKAAKGAMVGGLAGLIIGLAPFIIPGLGAIAAAGWLAMTLTGAAIGAGVGL